VPDLKTVLIADDDAFIREDIVDLLSDFGCDLLQTATARETFEIASTRSPHLILLDLRFPDCRDLSLLKRLRASSPQSEIIIVSSQTEDVSQIVEAIKLGAYDFVAKPFVREELRNRVEKALRLQRLQQSNQHLLSDAKSRNGIERMVGDSAAMKAVRETLPRLAALDGVVLVLGESGTGKELAARALHFMSKRALNPFVVVNCASLPESLIETTFFGHKRGAFTGASENVKGCFETAEDGTLFLDEIGDMPLAQQAALLRVLEYRKFTPVGDTRERHCNARFVFATNRDLKAMVDEGRFRQDLYYRIRVATVQMPPLRSRLEDIPALVSSYTTLLCAEMGRAPMPASTEVLEVFQRYDWPGNVRELRNVLESTLMLSEPGQREIMLKDLPVEVLAAQSGSAPAPSPQDHQEKRALIEALRQSGGNQTTAAKLLGCHRNTVRARIRHHGINGME